jgi:hypothetical protein
VYQGAQYGEARRFLNHLFISTDFEISYLPYDIRGSFFDVETPLVSERSLVNNDIGVDPIPSPPTVCTASNTNANYKFTITFNAPPVGSTTGVYLQQVPGNLENWDIVPIEDPQLTTYTFTNLGEGQVFKAAISVIGFYDESILFYQQTPNITVTGSSAYTFQVIIQNNRSDRNNIEPGEIIFNDYKIATKELGNLPQLLTLRSQIISVSITFYININSSNSIPGDSIYFPPSYPSDARLEIENGGTETGDNNSWSFFEYMYWKKVTPDEEAGTQDSDVFGSTGFPGTNYGGLPLPWAKSVLTSAAILDQIFPSTNDVLDSLYVPNLRFFIGYASNQLVSDSEILPIYEYSIEYTV